MEKNPLVSVIVPTYNIEAFVGDALDSLLAQTYPNVEVIVVDDGSRDNTPTIVEGYGEKLRYYRFDKNRGVPAVLNDGLSKAKGDFVLFFDADDIMEPDAIDRFVSFLKKHPEAAFAYCALYIFYNDRAARHEFLLSYPERATFQRFVEGNFLKLSQVMIRRAFLVGGRIVLDSALRYGGDWDLWLQLTHAGGTGLFLNARLVNSRERANGLSSSVRGKFLAKKEALSLMGRWGAFLTADEKAGIRYQERIERTKKTMLFNALGVDAATRSPVLAEGYFSSRSERAMVLFVRVAGYIIPSAVFGAAQNFYYRTKMKLKLIMGDRF